MSELTCKKTVSHAAQAGAQAAWIQWSTLGSMAAANRYARSVVDPEALVLLSLILEDYERRLSEMLAWWAAEGATTLSVQRIKNLVSRLPQAVHERLEVFGNAAIQAGDIRWRSLSKGLPKSRGTSKSVHLPELRLDRPASLMVRLRLGFGVGIKSDVLSFLLTNQGEWESVRSISNATAFTPRAVKRASDELAVARLIQSSATQPTEYRAENQAWASLLSIGAPFPKWRHWPAVVELLAGILEWGTAAPSRSTYVRSSTARDVIESHWRAFALNRIPVTHPSVTQGGDYLEAFRETVETFSDWLVESV